MKERWRLSGLNKVTEVIWELFSQSNSHLSSPKTYSSAGCILPLKTEGINITAQLFLYCGSVTVCCHPLLEYTWSKQILHLPISIQKEQYGLCCVFLFNTGET